VTHERTTADAVIGLASVLSLVPVMVVADEFALRAPLLVVYVLGVHYGLVNLLEVVLP
jgi:hypothetical protein